MPKRGKAKNVIQDKVFKAVEGKRDRLISLLKDLIRIPTVVPPGNNYEEMVQYLEPQFQKLGFKTERVIVPSEEIEKINSLIASASLPLRLEGPRINLVASRDHERKEPVTIYAHMDVVPIQEPWTKDPFNAIVEDGKLYGRGALDMKSGIASMLVTLEVLHELELTPHFDIICTLCTDEEIGGYPGILHLARHGYVKGHVINMEGGEEGTTIMAGLAGTMTALIRTQGRSCHSGVNFLGVNAVEAMIPILNELQALKEKVEQRESTIPLHPVIKRMGAPSDKVTPMFNIGAIRGGFMPNIVPAECQVAINRRYIPEETYDQVVKEIKEAVQRGKAQSNALDVKTLYVDGYRPFKTDTTSKYALKMLEALKAIHGYKDSDIQMGGAAGSIDSGFIPQVCDVDKIICIGAASADNLSMHQPDEYVVLDDLVNLTKQLAHYLAL